jgi:hypothetical protein
MSQFELRPCTVCGLLDGDYRPKKVTYCSVCDVWLCQKDVGDVVRRAVAAYKRQKGRLRKEWDKLRNLMFMGYGDEWSVVDDAGGGVLFVEQVLSGGAIVVQFTNCDTSASSNCTANFGVPITPGNYIFCYSIGTGNTTGISCTMTGETITRQTGTAGCSNNAGIEADCYLATNAVGGQTAITCTQSTGSGPGGRCIFAEVSSPLGGKAKDAGGNAHSVVPAMSVPTSAATTNPADICLGMAGNSFASSPGYTALSWTPVINSFNSNGTIMLMSTIPGSTGVQTATGTAQTGVSNQPQGVLCLKP